MNKPEDLVKGADGERFGAIPEDVAAAINCICGPICLPYGVPGPRGFGELHVESNPSRMHLIQSFGFKRFAGFAHFIASGYDWVGEGDRGCLMLVRQKDAYDMTLIIRPAPDLVRWNITTGYPKRVQDRKKLLWERLQEGRSEPSPDVVNRPRLETLTLHKKTKS
ncbi:hypothetical protein [Dongia sedimenti]|uniref:Uncharacterized protein n=1 Tax=Dongia sedimenti TaxID=3064282 RepID=A0ABU0YJ15_9PROT|nr:hypothetical protein [Rhodospirillaceae bacterium R-7]